MRKSLKAVTLLELLIAVSLVAVVGLAIFNLGQFSRVQALSSERKASLQSDVSVVLEHMTKFVGRAIGDPTNPPVTLRADGTGFDVRVDGGPDFAVNPPNGRLDLGLDPVVSYRLVPSMAYGWIQFYPGVAGGTGGGLESLTRRARMGAFNSGPNAGMNATIMDENQLSVTVRACWFPSSLRFACGSPENPAVEMTTSIYMPSVSCQ